MLSTHNTNSILSKDNNSSYSQPAPFKSTFSLSIGCVVIGLLLAGATVVFIWRRALGRPPAFDFGRGAWVPGVSRGFGERPRLWDRWREVPSHDQPLEWAKMKVRGRCSSLKKNSSLSKINSQFLYAQSSRKSSRARRMSPLHHFDNLSMIRNLGII